MSGNCADCGKFRKHLHRHHLKPRCKGGRMKDGTVYLCANCHEDRRGGTYANEVDPIERRRQSKRMKARWKDPVWRKKQIATFSKRGRNAWSKEAQGKRKQAAQRLRNDPEWRRKLLAGQKRARRLGKWNAKSVSHKLRRARKKHGNRWLLKDR